MRRTPLLLAVVCLLGACREAALTARPEPEANAALTALSAAGIEATKTSAGRDGFDVRVPGDQLEPALAALAAAGLPRPPEPGLTELFPEPGLVPSPTEERVRYHHALSGELARTLRTLPGVLEARVHLALPPEPPGRLGRTPPQPVKASVLLKCRREAAGVLGEARADVQRLVAGAVAALTPEAVQVVLAPAAAPASPPLEQVEPPLMQRALLGGGGLAAFLGLALVGLALSRRDRRALPEAATGEAT